MHSSLPRAHGVMVELHMTQPLHCRGTLRNLLQYETLCSVYYTVHFMLLVFSAWAAVLYAQSTVHYRTLHCL